MRLYMHFYREVHVSWLLSMVLLVFSLLYGFFAAASTSEATSNYEKVFNLGVVLNSNSSTGKEVYNAIEIACRDFNAISRSAYKLKPHSKSWRNNSFEAISAAEELIKTKKVKVLISMDTWEEVALVTGIGNRFHVPVISLARTYNQFIRPKSLPGLIQMGIDESEQIRCIADILHSYNRQRVSIIYEESEAYFDEEHYSRRSLYSLSEALRDVRSEIEEQLALPSLYSLTSSSPKASIKEQLSKLTAGNLSPVVIVLGLSSSEMATHLLEQAWEMGFFNQNDSQSIWIFSEKFLNQLNLSVTAASNGSSMKSGALNIGLGVMTNPNPRNNNNSKLYLEFRSKFRLKLKKHEPSIDALRAYDCVALLSKAVYGLSDHEIINSNKDGVLFRRILESDLEYGLSADQIRFKGDRIVIKPTSSNNNNVAVVSVRYTIGNRSVVSYKELKLWWSQKRRFTPITPQYHGKQQPFQLLAAARPDDDDDSCCEEEEFKIAVPFPTFLGKFVKEEPNGMYSGFCIEIFNAAMGIIKRNTNLTFNPVFVRHNGTYDGLVDEVYNKTYDAAVGDITILANRSHKVDFTQPFIESGLSMIVVAEPDKNKALDFMRPFTPSMWIASGGLLMSTMLTIWFLEHPSNPEFRGAGLDQLSTAIWFTFSSLFFAHSERINRKITRIVVIVWFFVALILIQSYTASLTSMLTVERLKPSVVTMEWLKQNNAKVGCDATTFLCDYLEHVHKFDKEKNIVALKSNYSDYEKELSDGNVKALFLEYPYERAFFSRYCTGYSVAHQSDRFGGFGFVFQKGSKLTDMFSEAILELSEEGRIKEMGDSAFISECISSSSSTTTTSSSSSSSSEKEKQRLGLNSFWALYVFSLATSALCVIYSYICGLKLKRNDVHARSPTSTNINEGSRSGPN